MIKKLLLTLVLISAPLLYVFDDELYDIADIKCEVAKRSIIGYPIRMCSIAFDDKGILARIIN